MLKDSINKSAKKHGINPYVLAQIIQSESSWVIPYENKSMWNKIKLFFSKIFKINKEVKSQETFGLGQFSRSQIDKNNDFRR